MTKDSHGIVYRREQCYKLLYRTLTESQSRWKIFYLNKDKEKYKKTETDVGHSKSSRSRYQLHCYHHGRKNCTCQLETRPVFGRFSFKYYRSFPVKRGAESSGTMGHKDQKRVHCCCKCLPRRRKRRCNHRCIAIP